MSNEQDEQVALPVRETVVRKFLAAARVPRRSGSAPGERNASGVLEAGGGMKFEYLYPLQLGQCSGWLVQAVALIAAAAKTTN